MQSQGGNKEISLQAYYNIGRKECQVAIEFDEFRKAISSAAKLADEIDSGEARNIRCMEIYVIDLLSQIAENITYSE